MTRPCGCQADPITFGHDHPADPLPWIMTVIWHADPLQALTGGTP